MHDDADFAHPALEAVEAFGGHLLVALALGAHTPNVLREADELGQAVAHDVAVVGAAHRGQGHAVGGVGDGAHGLPDHVHLPVAGLAALEQRVQRPCGGPHDVGARLVVLRVLHRDAARVDKRAHQTLGDIVGRVVARAGEVLLHDVAHDVEETGHHLVLRHSHGEARVEDGELREDVAAEHFADFETGLVVGDDAAAVHLAAGAHHGQHRAHGHNLAARPALVDVVFLPRVFLAPGRGADALGIVDGAAAADGQDEVYIVVPHQLATLIEFLHRGVGHHAGVLDNRFSGLFQGRHDGVVHAVLLDGTAAVTQHDSGAVAR